MITYFNEADLVSFGNYLNSEKRIQLFSEHPELGTDNLQERLFQVHDADLQNWKESLTNNG